MCLIQDDKDLYEEIISTSSGDLLFKVKRNSEVLSSLTRDRAPPPKNRRRPSLKKRSETSEIFTNSEEEELDKVSPLYKGTGQNNYTRTGPTLRVGRGVLKDTTYLRTLPTTFYWVLN